MSRARSVADLGNQSLNLTVSDGTLKVGTGVTFENNGKSQFSGIVTAFQFVGDGSGLTGVTGTGSGVVVQEEGVNVGTAATINFVGSAVTATLSNGVATVEISSSGGGGGGGGDTVSITPSADDILSVSSGAISVDSPGTDKLIFWDNSTSKLTYLTAGANLTISDTTISTPDRLSDIREDTTPQLGGNLDVNNYNITGTGNVNLTGDAIFSGNVTATSFIGSLATTNLTGTITNAQLANSSVSFGDVSVSLGSSDPTPAFDLTDATNYRTSNLVGTITNAQLAGSIANSKLVNSSVSFGGISLPLGNSDATPAFDLTDATNYRTSNLVGTITNSQLAGSITNDKLAGSITDDKLASTFLKNVSEDTTPQLGGNLDLNSNDITGTGDVNLTGVVTATSFSGSGANLSLLTGASSGTYGSSSVIPVIAVNASGRITGISTTGVSGGGGGGGINDIVQDITPQLGGDLDLNSKDITGTGNINITGVVTATSFSGSLATTNLTGTITNDQLAGSIADAKLASIFLKNVSDDISPQLGGNLNLNNKTITGTGDVNLTGDGYFSGDLSLGNYYNPTIDLNGSSGNVKFIGTAKFGGNIATPNITLNKSGDSTFVGVITANSFVKTGGTSSQYLMADGSVTTGGGGGGGSYGDSDVNSHLNVSSASSGQILSWNGSDYAWVADQTGGGGGGGTGYFSNNQTNVGIHTTSSHVGLGTTNPITSVQINNVYGIETGSGTFQASAGVAYTANTYASTNFVNAEYTLFFSHLSGIQSQKVLVMDNNSTAYSQEYAIMNSSDRLVSVGATIRSGNVELMWTPETGINGTITYRFTRETMI